MADLRVRSSLDDSLFNQGLARMRSQAGAFNKQISSDFAKIFSGAALAGGVTAAVYGIGAAIKSAFSNADKVSDLAEMLREMPADLVAVGGAAMLMGSDMETVNRAAVKLRVNLGKVAEGDKEITETMKIMGLNARELSRMPLPEMIIALAGGFQKAEASGRGYAAVQSIIGKGGADLIALFRKSPEELSSIFEDMKPKSSEAIQALDDLGDAFERLKIKAGNAAMSYIGGFVIRVAALKKSISEKGLLETAKGMPANPNPFVPTDQEKADFAKDRGQGQAPQNGFAETPDDKDKDAEKQRKEVERLTDAYWKAKEARDAANATDQQNLERMLGALAEMRNRMARGNLDQQQTLTLRTQEQVLLKAIEDAQRRIAENKKREREEAKREAERGDKSREDKMQEAAKQREYALEAAIAKLKSDGKNHAIEEAQLRVRAAERELDFARGSRREAEAYVALLNARNNLSSATGAAAGKSKNERIEEYMSDGMKAGDAKRKVRQEDRDARHNNARINAFRRGAEQAPNMMGDGVRDYMDTHKNVNGSRAFESGKWEQVGRPEEKIADSTAGRGNDDGMQQLVAAVNELKASIEKATGGA